MSIVRGKYAKPNKIIDCLWFSSNNAWIEEVEESNSQKKNKIVKTIKGSVVETALLRFIIKNFKDEYDLLKSTKINVLHWKSFNPVRKRSTLVMQYNNVDDRSSQSQSDSESSHDVNAQPKNYSNVFVFSKGAPDEIFGICNRIFIDEDGNFKEIDDEAEEIVAAQRKIMSEKQLKNLMFAVNEIPYGQY